VKQAVHTFEITTRGKGLYEFTSKLSEWIGHQQMHTGLLTVFCRHTSASLLIQENADPTVRVDLKAYLDPIAPDDGPYQHKGVQAVSPQSSSDVGYRSFFRLRAHPIR
jgi:secondary thiamine-phosphate synthase enzyme